MLTLPLNEDEGHLSYLSQSAYLAKGTTVGDGPMTPDESVHGMRLRVIERAQGPGNVCTMCRERGSRGGLLSLAQAAGMARGTPGSPGRLTVSG